MAQTNSSESPDLLSAVAVLGTPADVSAQGCPACALFPAAFHADYPQPGINECDGCGSRHRVTAAGRVHVTTCFGCMGFYPVAELTIGHDDEPRCEECHQGHESAVAMDRREAARESYLDACENARHA